MSKRVNAMPWGRLWIPLLDRKYGWVVLLAVIACPVLLYIGFKFGFAPILLVFLKWTRQAADAAAGLTPRGWFLPVRLAVLLFWFVLFIFPPTTLGLLFWFFHGVRGFFGDRRQELTRRKQLAALFAVRNGTGPAGVERLIHDDAAYAERIGRFLQVHQLRMPVPLYDDQGRYPLRGATKARVLAEAMVRAIGRARDHELY